MKWLVITQSTQTVDEISNLLQNLDKKNKCSISSFESASIKKLKKNLKNFASIIVFSETEENISEKILPLFYALCGFASAEKIPLITNISKLSSLPLFTEEVTFVKNLDDFIKTFSVNYEKIANEAKKRLAKNKLLNRGIPFTSDCFGTYIAKNKLEIVEEFLEAGMSVNSRDDTGTPMLNIACRNDNFEFVEMILNLGAELNAISEDRGYTAVMDAVWRGNEKITKFLISKGAELNTINKEGQTNLILAVGANRENLVKILAENGADPDVRDMMGMSAYSYASLFKKERLLEILKPYHKES